MLISKTWTNKTFVNVRDQLFNHKLHATEYYFDQNVQVNIKVCFLKRSFNEMMQKMTRLVNLIVDFNTSIELSKKQKTEFCKHFNVICFSNRYKTFTVKLKSRSYKFINIAKETSLYDQKIKTQAWLNLCKVRLRHFMIEKIQKRYFRKIDTIFFDSQFFVSSSRKMLISNESATRCKYNIFEQVEIVQWICQSTTNFTDEKIFIRRIKNIEVLTILCHWQETQRRDRLK